MHPEITPWRYNLYNESKGSHIQSDDFRQLTNGELVVHREVTVAQTTKSHNRRCIGPRKRHDFLQQ